MDKLKKQWYQLVSNYSSDQETIKELWEELKASYSETNRYYHNLDHLTFILEKAGAFRKEIKDYDTFLFSIFYHDIIYDINRQDNEYQSSIKAMESLKKLNVPEPMISKCMQQILATMDHAKRDDPDLDLFTDVDLAVLGEEWKVYEAYKNKIRAEYGAYPDDIYNSGRLVVLKRFLNMEKIFKTPEFYQSHEKSARENLQKEMENIAGK